MKKLIGGWAAAAGLLLSGGAMAQGYVSVGAGQSNMDVDCSGYASCDKSGTAVKVVGGYNLAEGLSVEVGYLDFGKAKASDPGVNVEIKASALTLGGAYKANFTPELAGHLRLGIASVKAKGTVSGAINLDDSATKVKPYYGLGLSYAFSKDVALEIGADFTQAEIDDKADVRAITAGVRFSF